MFLQGLVSTNLMVLWHFQKIQIQYKIMPNFKHNSTLSKKVNPFCILLY